jgi:guanylate kinase
MKCQKLFIISGPSGSGQDSIIEALRKFLPIERVITTTTREMRPKESQKNPYYFVSRENFLERIRKQDFAEYAQEYNGNYYGVTMQELERVNNSGKIGIWKIEYQGVLKAKELFPGIIAILISAPLEILEKRIRVRDKGKDEAYTQERLKYTEEFLKHRNIYDFEVINNDGKMEEAIKKVTEIIKKHIS